MGLVVDEEGPILVIRLESGRQIRLPGKFEKRKHDKVRVLYDYGRNKPCEIMPDELIKDHPYQEPPPIDKEIWCGGGALGLWDGEFEGCEPGTEEASGIEELPEGEESPGESPHGVWW